MTIFLPILERSQIVTNKLKNMVYNLNRVWVALAYELCDHVHLVIFHVSKASLYHLLCTLFVHYVREYVGLTVSISNTSYLMDFINIELIDPFSTLRLRHSNNRVK